VVWETNAMDWIRHKPFNVEWKKPFKSTVPGGEIPERFQNQDPPARTGTIQAGQDSVPYLVTGNPKGKDMAMFIDRLEFSVAFQ